MLWSGPSWVAAEGSDANGNGWLVTSFFVNPWYANTTIQLTVTDALTGQAATDVFTDSPTPLFPVPPLVAPVIPDTSADLAYQANIIANYDTVDAHGTPTGPNANDPGGSFTDGSLNVLNLTFPGASAAANGALFDQALHVVGGSGTYDAFLRIHAEDQLTTEQGYNTNAATSNDKPMQDVGGNHFLAKVVNINDFATVNADGTPWTGVGTPYYEFKLDINQSAANPLLTLDELQIFQSSSPNLGAFDPPVKEGGGGTAFGTPDLNGNITDATGASATYGLAYDLNSGGADPGNAVVLDARLTAGLGQGDAFVLVPVSDFALDPIADPYVYLYSAFGQELGDVANGGFEQWGFLHKTGTALHPDLQVTKAVTGVTPAVPDSDTTPDPAGFNAENNGDVIHYSITVFNDGNEAISSVNLTDALLQGPHGVLSATGTVIDTDGDGGDTAATLNPTTGVVTGTLDAGDSWVFTGTYTVQQADINTGGFVQNDVTVTGRASDGTPLTGGDSVKTPVEQEPDLALTKSISGITYALTDPAGLPQDNKHVDGAGDVIHYNINVTNTGNIDLAGTNLNITDSQADGGILTPVGFNPATDTLAPGQTWTFTAVHTVTQPEMDSGASIINTADVTDKTDKVVHDDNDTAQSDPAFISQDPALTIVKTVDGVNADGVATDLNSAILPIVLVGSTVHFKYVVTNTGNIDLAPGLSDSPNPGSGVTVSDTNWAPGQSYTYTATTTALAGEHDNTATATGTYDTNQNVTATDQGGYIGVTPSINIEKLVSIDYNPLNPSAANWYFTADDPADTVAAISSLTGIPTAQLHIGTPTAVVGSHVSYQVWIQDTSGNGIGENTISVTDPTLDPSALVHAFTVGATLADQGIEHSQVVTTTLGTGFVVTNTATVNGTAFDSFNDTSPVTDQDSASVISVATLGLTKGYWANHQSQWGPGALNPNTATGGPHPGYLSLGDLNHDGTGDVTGLALVDNGGLLFTYAVADALLNSNVTGDARVILVGQALAAELNDYQAGGHEPDGLIEAAVQWLTGTTTHVGNEMNPFPTAGLKTTTSNIDSNHDGLINATDYSTSSGTFANSNTTALSSSRPRLADFCAGIWRVD